VNSACSWSSAISRQPVERGLQLVAPLRVLARHLEHRVELAGVGLQPLERLQLPLRAGALGGNLGGGALVIPERRRLHRRIELAQPPRQ
jgi:hypothetical protein